MTISESVEELVRIYRGTLLLPTASAIDYSRDVVSQGKGGHGKPPSFGADPPLSVQMEQALARFVRVWQRRLDEARAGANGRSSHDRTSTAKREEDKAILASIGEDPTALAFLYGRTTEGVRKLRRRHGLDPDTGERVKRDTLTAPARAALEAHERRTKETP